MKIPALIAHRGYASQYPENTLVAFEAAINAGAQFIECDVQLSADLQPVLFHDATMDRICGQPGSIHELTLSELRHFPAALPEKFGNKFAEVPIATLQDLISLLEKHLSVSAFIELKRNSIKLFGAEKVISSVLNNLEEIRDRTIVISYNIDALYEAKKSGWNQVGVVVDSWQEINQTPIIDLQPQYVFCNITGLPPDGMISFPNAKIAVFEVADPELALQLTVRGVDMVETFAVREMLTAIKKMASHA